MHPYLRRRNGEEPVTYPHPLLEQCLEKTLGVPLFQEQLMQMAIDVAGFTPGESDRLRQAMGSKRSRARMAAMRDRLYAGMAERGITGDVADDIVHKIEGFADFGFPESHSVSFAYLVYASSWIKLHYPAEFACALLNAQPMGFYSPHTIVRDADPPRGGGARPVRAARRGATARSSRAPRRRVRSAARARAGTPTRRSTRCASGCGTCAGLSSALLDRIDDERAEQPFTDLEDFTRRTGAPTDALENARHRRRVRVLRRDPAQRAVGRGRVARRACPTSCRAWSPAPRRRRCRG